MSQRPPLFLPDRKAELLLDGAQIAIRSPHAHVDTTRDLVRSKSARPMLVEKRRNSREASQTVAFREPVAARVAIIHAPALSAGALGNFSIGGVSNPLHQRRPRCPCRRLRQGTGCLRRNVPAIDEPDGDSLAVTSTA